jgi:hypothetical protein
MRSTAITSVQDLRRITEAIDQLRGRSVEDVNIRSDCRQLRVKLVPRLDVDVLLAPQKSRAQIEVRFDTGT